MEARYLRRMTSTTGRRIRGLNADERRAQRRAQLLDAALDLFAENGYQNTSIEQLCQRAYVGTKAFYELFTSKEDCYLALLRQVSTQLEQQVVAAFNDLPDDVVDPVPPLVAGFAHALVDDPRLGRVTFGEAAGISPAVENQRRTNRRWAAAFVETLWARLDGGQPQPNYRPMAIGTIGGMFELIADWLHEPADVDTLITELTDFAQAVRRGSQT